MKHPILRNKLSFSDAVYGINSPSAGANRPMKMGQNTLMLLPFGAMVLSLNLPSKPEFSNKKKKKKKAAMKLLTSQGQNL